MLQLLRGFVVDFVYIVSGGKDGEILSNDKLGFKGIARRLRFAFLLKFISVKNCRKMINTRLFFIRK